MSEELKRLCERYKQHFGVGFPYLEYFDYLDRAEEMVDQCIFSNMPVEQLYPLAVPNEI